MPDFETKRLPAGFDGLAPDGGEVRILLALHGGSFAHFQLEPGKTSKPVAHRTVEEIWYFVGGLGEFWRAQDGREEVVQAEPGVCLTVPLGTRFQFRSFGPDPLAAVAVTMPPWPGDDEAYPVEGKWEPKL